MAGAGGAGLAFFELGRLPALLVGTAAAAVPCHWGGLRCNGWVHGGVDALCGRGAVRVAADCLP